MIQFPSQNPSPDIGGIGTSSTSSTEPLSPEAERLLGGVPDSIGDVQDQPLLPDAIEPEQAGADDAIASLMQSIAFEPQDVQDQLGELFEWLAERYKSDHWKLTERQARMLGRPTAQLLNSVWTRIQTVLPDILARWCDDTPGATAFLLACGIVVAPKVAKQFAISKARKHAGAAERMVRSSRSNGPQPAPTAQPKPQPAGASGMIYSGE